MAGADYPLWAAIRSIREGMTATAGLRAFRAAGGSVRTQTWYRLRGEAETAIGDRIAELSRPVNRRPVAGEINRFSTVTSRGFIQQVDVFVRDRATGDVFAQPYSVWGDRLVTRAEAMSQAIDAFEGGVSDGDYDEEVLGAMPAGTYEMIPSEFL